MSNRRKLSGQQDSQVLTPLMVDMWKMDPEMVPAWVRKQLAAQGYVPLVPTERLVEAKRALARAQEVRDSAEYLLGVVVDDCRATGSTWGHVGDLLGVSPQAAQQRYGGQRADASG